MLISSMFWQNRAIHAVPSACSRHPPVGSGALRSNTPMLPRPRNPPSKPSFPLDPVLAPAGLAVDPPGEVEEQLLETALEPLPVPLPGGRLLQPVGEDGGP